MFTTQFKVTLAVLVFLVVCGALVFNQLVLQNRVAALENSQTTRAFVQVVTPSATPSATLSPTSSLKVLPKVPVRTQTLATPTTAVRVTTPVK